MTRRERRGERGSYLVMAAFILMVLMIVGAMAVDIVRKYRLEQAAQDVADAAALAGARQLPDAAAARTAAIRYIQQYGSDSYVPGASDIQIAVSPDNQSGTCGVIVYGAWDAIFMPMWLTGDPQYGISRYAMATMKRTFSQETTYTDGTFDNAPGGDYALFANDSSVISSMAGNSICIIGDAHFNDHVTISTHTQNMINGTFEAASYTGGGGITPVVSGQEAMPTLNTAGLVTDVYLDENNAAMKTYYATAQSLLGTNGAVVPNTTCQWDAVNSKWIITSTGNVTAALAGQTAAWGNGVDVHIVGAADVSFPNGSSGGSQNYWLGSFRTTKLLTVKSNNSEIRATGGATMPAISGKDNDGLAIYAGMTFGSSTVGFNNDGNCFDVYGLLYTPGTLAWSGNMNNYSASYEGTAGAYDCVGNGFIKGAAVCGALSSTGNNFKVYYDGTLTDGVPITNAISLTPPRYSTPRITLIK